MRLSRTWTGSSPSMARCAQRSRRSSAWAAPPGGRGRRGLGDVVGRSLAFVGVLVVLVLVHELGHFIVAKRAGITVQEFGVGFPPRIGSVAWHGTPYSVN